MLEKLAIKNYLLLKDIEINFNDGLNIITGETGAGKTILINALSLLLGERADYSIISKNKEKMVIEGIVRVNKKIFKQYNIDNPDSDYVIIRRELYSKGYSRNFINDTPVSINDLSSIGDTMIDIHSQNEHQLLLKKETHIEFLDLFIAGTDKKFLELMNGYRAGYEKITNLSEELTGMRDKKNELENKRNFLEFQLKEINETDPKPGEDDELDGELKISENAEQIKQSLSSAYIHLYEDKGSVTERIKLAEKELEKIKQFNKEIQQILAEFGRFSPLLNELSRQIYDLLNSINFDAESIERARERLYKLQYLKKKYGGNLEAVLKLKEELGSDLSLLENFDDKLSKLEKELSSLRDDLYKKSVTISKTRKVKSTVLETSIQEVLKELGLENTEFKINFKHTAGDTQDNLSINSRGEYIKLTKDGIDDAEFLIKINKGEEFLPLKKTASGGEISRIMLALKTVLAETCLPEGKLGTGTLVFDEIDTGISGRVAQKAGILLRKLSKTYQVIAITHLAQIAALSNEHFLVEKETDSEQTYAKIRKLNDNEKVIEVAKLLSGKKVTDSAIKGAKELMNLY